MTVCVRNFLICVRRAIFHWTRHFAKLNVNKVNMVYCSVLILVAVVPLDVHFHYIENVFICMALIV